MMRKNKKDKKLEKKSLTKLTKSDKNKPTNSKRFLFSKEMDV